MLKTKHQERTRAQESTNAIERLYISMRHLFSRGFYKPMGVSGETLRKSLLLLRPEIYGSIAEDRVELNGLIYSDIKFREFFDRYQKTLKERNQAKIRFETFKAFRDDLRTKVVNERELAKNF